MKVVFVENRYKTVLFEKIANELQLKGVESTFLVQNKFFKPKKCPFHLLKFPKKHHLKSPNKQVSEMSLERKDRGYKYFNSGNLHYNYYYDEIKAFLTKVMPCVVFGESTLFHELITIEVCKEVGIKYLHPTSCRYPSGYMSFYENDTLIPFDESKDFTVKSEDNELAFAIANRQVKPDYMYQSLGRLEKIINKIHSTVTLTMSYYSGEKYNTPSPLVKYKLNRRVQQLQDSWEKNACSSLGDVKDWNKTVLFPLQMQPEANLDVWGFPYNNQVSVIKKLLEIMPLDWQLIIKPNPKSKYEMTPELINLVRLEPRCLGISHKLKMDIIFNKVTIFFGITGTICYECIFANKLVFSPVLPILKLFAEQQSCFPDNNTFNSFEKVDIENNSAKLVAYLRANSFKGVVTDHFHSNYAYSSENITDLSNAFYKVIKKINNVL